jgi:hypothetical protein
MEGVSSVMPLAVKAGAQALGQAMAGGSTDPFENKAQAAEAQASRRAQSQQRAARDAVREQREQNQHRNASARVAAANSGLTLSGSSLLNLESLEQAGDEKISRAMGESALRIQDILDTGAEQARSIRLSGRSAATRLGGIGSLLRLGAQSDTVGGAGRVGW